jgi:hypothetical protein
VTPRRAATACGAPPDINGPEPVAKRWPEHLDVRVPTLRAALPFQAWHLSRGLEDEIDHKDLEHVGKRCRLLGKRKQVLTFHELPLEVRDALGLDRPGASSRTVEDAADIEGIASAAFAEPGHEIKGLGHSRSLSDVVRAGERVDRLRPLCGYQGGRLDSHKGPLGLHGQALGVQLVADGCCHNLCEARWHSVADLKLSVSA